jgi:hypothetical protein
MCCDFFPLKKHSSFVFADLFCYLFVLKFFVRFPACVFLYVKAVQILVNMASLFSPNGGQHVGTGEPLLSNSPVKKLLRSAKRATVFVNRQLPLLTLGATAGGVVGVLAWYIREKDFMIVNLAKQLEKSRREKEELKQNLIKEQEELEEKLIEIAKLKEKNFRNLLKPAESPLFNADNNSASLTGKTLVNELAMSFELQNYLSNGFCIAVVSFRKEDACLVYQALNLLLL